MKSTTTKKVLVIALALVMVFTFAGCEFLGSIFPFLNPEEPNPDNPNPDNPNPDNPNPDNPNPDNPTPDNPNPTPTKPQSYSEGYNFWDDIWSAMETAVNDIVDANNARLEEEKPDDYWTDETYLTILYMPFFSLDLAFTASVNDQMTEYTIKMLFGEEATFTKLTSGHYKIRFTGEEYDESYENVIDTYEVELELRFDVETSSMSYVERVDGIINVFHEYIGLGNDRYALQNKTNRAIVTYKDGVVTELIHSWTKYDTNYETGELEDYSRWYDYEECSIWGKKNLDASWVTELEEGNHLKRIYEIKDDTFTIRGQNQKSDYDTGEWVYYWEDYGPIVIKKP